MNIQALIFDLDGTAFPANKNGVPSQKVVDTVQKAKKFCHVSVATGRPYAYAKNILEALDIDDLCILSGGTSLYSCKTKTNVWEQQMDPESLQEALFSIKDIVGNHMVEDNIHSFKKVVFFDYKPLEPTNLVCIYAVTREEAKDVTAKIKNISGFTAHAMGSWTPGLLDIHIVHELATKKHALVALLSRLNVDHDQTMVVGDGDNDLPLFELAGTKVAMGNASHELKAKADWIAPSVDEDGLAVAIEKYILKTA